MMFSQDTGDGKEISTGLSQGWLLQGVRPELRGIQARAHLNKSLPTRFPSRELVSYRQKVLAQVSEITGTQSEWWGWWGFGAPL